MGAMPVVFCLGTGQRCRYRHAGISHYSIDEVEYPFGRVDYSFKWVEYFVGEPVGLVLSIKSPGSKAGRFQKINLQVDFLK